MTAQKDLSGEQLLGANGVRALACLWVFGRHLGVTKLSIVPESVQPIFESYGDMGVPVFFVLSGFLLSAPFWRRWVSGADFPSLRSYAIRRLARIVPGYYVCLLVTFFFIQPMPLSELKRLGTALLFVNSFHWSTYFPTRSCPPLWSIGIEMVFYVLLPLWAAGLWFVRRRFWPVAYMAATCLTLVALQWALSRPEASAAVNLSAPDEERQEAAVWVPLRNPVGLFAHFLFGCAAGGVMARWPRKQSPEQPTRTIGLNIFDVLSVLALLLIAIDLYAERHPPHWLAGAGVLGRLFDQRHVWFMQYRWPAFPALVAILLVALARSNRVGRYFDNPLLTLTATLSFGIYLWHVPTIRALRAAWCDFVVSSTSSQAAFIVSTLLGTYIVAMLSYHLIERPALTLAHRFLLHQRQKKDVPDAMPRSSSVALASTPDALHNGQGVV